MPTQQQQHQQETYLSERRLPQPGEDDSDLLAEPVWCNTNNGLQLVQHKYHVARWGGPVAPPPETQLHLTERRIREVEAALSPPAPAGPTALELAQRRLAELEAQLPPPEPPVLSALELAEQRIARLEAQLQELTPHHAKKGA